MGSDLHWLTLASKFPPTLDSATDRTQLPDGSTPDAYGISMDNPGWLVAGTCPTGTAAIAKTYTINTVVYSYYYDRLWRIIGSQLQWGAKNYIGRYYREGVGQMTFAEDSNSVLKILPFAGDAIYVGKATGGYMIPNVTRDGANFVRTDINQKLKISSAANCCEHNQILYVSNANGLFAFDGQTVVELTENVRSLVSTYFADTALTVDFQKGQVIGTSKFLYDTQSKKLMIFSGSSVRFTTRTLTDGTADKAPFRVTKVGFYFERSDSSAANLTFQVRRDGGWSVTPQTVRIGANATDNHQVVETLSDFVAGSEFTLRITSMTSNLRVREIQVETSVRAAKESYRGN